MQSSLNPLCLLLGQALLLNHDLRSSVCCSHNDPSFGRANGDIFFSVKKNKLQMNEQELYHMYLHSRHFFWDKVLFYTRVMFLLYKILAPVTLSSFNLKLICYHESLKVLLTHWFSCCLLSGTTPRGDTGGGPSSACKRAGPRIPASLHPNICQDLQLRGLTAEREPCYLEQQSFCTDTLVMLMFDNKRSVIKLERKLCSPPFFFLSFFLLKV